MTDRKTFVVYLSSTLADLGAEREIALETIGQIGTVRTSYRATEEGAVATCASDVRECHLYVGILGQRYGYVPPVGENNPDGKSITELEYEACVRPGQPAVPRLMFIKSTRAGIAPQHIDAIANPQAAERMRTFLQRASADQIPFIFQTQDEFQAELRIRVAERADRFHRAGEKGTGMLATTKAGTWDIFLSYAREDESRVRSLVSALRAQGWSVFWDRATPPGRTWDEYIGQALDTCRCVVVAWSERSITSKWVREEAHQGAERDVLVPVLLDRVKQPFGFRQIQAADLSLWSGESEHHDLKSLIQSLRDLLESNAQ